MTFNPSFLAAAIQASESVIAELENSAVAKAVDPVVEAEKLKKAGDAKAARKIKADAIEAFFEPLRNFPRNANGNNFSFSRDELTERIFLCAYFGGAHNPPSSNSGNLVYMHVTDDGFTYQARCSNNASCAVRFKTENLADIKQALAKWAGSVAPYMFQAEAKKIDGLGDPAP